MSYKIRGAAPRQEIRRPAPENRSSRTYKHNRRESASPSAVDPPAPPRPAEPPLVSFRPRRHAHARPGGFAVFTFLLFAVFYLAGHVAVWAIGWQGLAVTAGALLYVVALATAWGIANGTRKGGPR